MDCETIWHSFIFQFRKKNVEEVTFEKMHNQTNASMASVALIETDEKMKFASESIEENLEAKRLQFQVVQWERQAMDSEKRSV
jgi:hypothetical protein